MGLYELHSQKTQGLLKIGSQLKAMREIQEFPRIHA